MAAQSFLKAMLGAWLLIACSEACFAQTPPVSPNPVVVELFQSQGCSSCPPAEANLNAVAGEPGILALSFGVTYWDSLGWKDTFATTAYTDRQWAYAHRRGRDNVWTPQIYVDGHIDLVGTDPAQLATAIAQARRRAMATSPSFSWQVNQLLIGKDASISPCDVWLVRYDTRTIQVGINAGENSGRTLPHRNVVRELIHLGRWDGSARTFILPPPALNGLSTTALVQSGAGGDIIGASKQPGP
ncbi:DUF1223 domain-containing protein [Rhodanobacter sp. L36]|uniref:DUF1223 domain-containing protein n=1 Tax=Rhodanobacter sp. L36 TaxID=1747221 RepID=UPI001C201E9B|nr:DUF1223 domain-containing protein [Rhodanobacter sp. L36]